MNTSFNYVAEKEFKANLEQVIDSKGFMYILSCMQEIAYGKAEHIAENWQDHAKARQYNNLAATLERFYSRLDKKPYNL